jgi:hypothetical protein
MENLLQSLLQNLNMDDLKNLASNTENMFEGCVNYLTSNDLTEEQCETIMEICQDKLDTIKSTKYVEQIVNIINQAKSQITSEHPLFNYLDSMYNIKAYTNADNNINEPKPSIELVIETNFQGKNITYFYEIVYNNLEEKVESNKSITIAKADEDEKMDDEDDEKEEEKMEDDDDEDEEETEKMDDVEDFNGDDCVEQLYKKMEWSTSPNDLKLLLNELFKVFEEEDTPICW